MVKRMQSKASNEITPVIAPRGGVDVHNVLDTKGEPIPNGYDSFLEYWEVNSGEVCPSECQAIDLHLTNDGQPADTTDIVGAHVRIDGLDCPDDYAWIVPLCKQCNNDDNESSISMPEGTIFIPVKMSKKHKTAGCD